MKTKLQLIRLILAGFLLISLQADEIVDNAKSKSTERFQRLFEKYHQSKSEIQSQRTQQENLQGSKVQQFNPKLENYFNKNKVNNIRQKHSQKFVKDDPEFAKKRQLFLQKNPEFAEFIKGLEGLSKFQRRRKIRNYLKSNPELANQIKEQMRNRKASSDGDSNQDIFNDRKGFGGRRGFMRMFR